jgi:hypothetical protein
METKGLLFIPDISGFTRFVNETEIGHGRLIIQELLEIIINSNSLDLKISEIEGDAILFYKFGEAPPLAELYRQVEEMFCNFHKNLLAYDNRRYCQCKACVAASGLTLKIITHFGEFTEYQVKEFRKLIGKDLIVAHQLLKNSIQPHEYWLVTESLLHGDKRRLPELNSWNQDIFKSESGSIGYFYTPLSSLRNSIEAETPPDNATKGMNGVLKFQQDYATDIITLFHAVGDFNYRHRWMDGVKMVEEVNHYLPRVGMKCKCILDGGNYYIYSSSYRYTDERICFTETNPESGSKYCFTLDKIDDHRTKLRIEYFIPAGLANDVMFRFRRKRKIRDSLLKSMDNLQQFAKEIQITGAGAA